MIGNGNCPLTPEVIKCGQWCAWYNHLSKRCVIHTIPCYLGSISNSLDEICEWISAKNSGKEEGEKQA